MRASTAGTWSASMPKCLGPPPIFMPERLELEVGVDSDRDTRGQPQLGAQSRLSSETSRSRLDVEQHPSSDCLAQLAFCLARPGEADLSRCRTRIQRHQQFTGRGHVNAVHQPRHAADQRGKRVGLHRVVQLHALREHAAKFSHTLAEQAAVVGIEGRLADARRDSGNALAADAQLRAGRMQSARRCVHRRAFRQALFLRALASRAPCGRSCRWGCAAKAPAPRETSQEP